MRRRFLLLPGVLALLLVSSSAVSSAATFYAGSTVKVSTAAQLKTALTDATPGQVIIMADGTYSDRFAITVQATAAKPIVLKGSPKAVIDGGDTSGGYALHLDNADYWQLTGFSVKGANKAIMIDSTNFATFTGLNIGNTGQEGIHFRNFSTDNLLRYSTVHNTGLVTPDYGEGIYIGTAKSNWSSVTEGKVDNSDRNRVLHNVVRNTAAESIDIKEGTSSGVIGGNVFDGTGITGANYSDSLIDVKGNGWLIARNRWIGSSSKLVDVIQTHVVVDGWGRNNAFVGNAMSITVPGYGINVSGAPNAIKCSNTQSGAKKGLSNIACVN